MLILHDGLKPIYPLFLLSDDLFEPLVLLGNQQCLTMILLSNDLILACLRRIRMIKPLGEVGAHEDLFLTIILIEFERAECPSLR